MTLGVLNQTRPRFANGSACNDERQPHLQLGQAGRRLQSTSNRQVWLLRTLPKVSDRFEYYPVGSDDGVRRDLMVWRSSWDPDLDSLLSPNSTTIYRMN